MENDSCWIFEVKIERFLRKYKLNASELNAFEIIIDPETVYRISIKK